MERIKANPIAIAISDLHLSLVQPPCRADKSWMDVQAGYLKQVRDFRDSLDADGKLPILCGGDIFDRWNAAPELINFALEHLPDGMLCVPGNHDLPNHRQDLMHRSGYGVLKQAGKIVDLSDKEYHKDRNMVVFGFGHGREIQPLRRRINDMPHIALIHHYVAPNREKAFPNAPEECLLKGKLEKILSSYDIVVMGDNHIPWMT